MLWPIANVLLLETVGAGAESPERGSRPLIPPSRLSCPKVFGGVLPRHTQLCGTTRRAQLTGTGPRMTSVRSLPAHSEAVLPACGGLRLLPARPANRSAHQPARHRPTNS